jgi:16S rRNA (cytidine1402-2'-O)-methyltransferase
MTTVAAKIMARPGIKSFVLYGQAIAAPQLEAGLHIVSTPIGNLEDITLRALKALAGADRIACEDTRVSVKLLQRYGIRAPLLSYHEHNAKAQGKKLLDYIESGEAVALISDAGTPLLSDPGAPLVSEVLGAGFKVFPYPGASALLAALVASGIQAEKFHFIGFLPPKSSARRKALVQAKQIPDTLVFYETAPRLAAALTDMAEILGDREVAMCRELTKLHETIVREKLFELAARFEKESVKGEIVLVIAPCNAQETSKEDIGPQLIRAMKKQSLKQAVAEVAAVSGVPRREVYAQALRLKDKK